MGGVCGFVEGRRCARHGALSSSRRRALNLGGACRGVASSPRTRRLMTARTGRWWLQARNVSLSDVHEARCRCSRLPFASGRALRSRRSAVRLQRLNPRSERVITGPGSLRTPTAISRAPLRAAGQSDAEGIGAGCSTRRRASVWTVGRKTVWPAAPLRRVAGRPFPGATVRAIEAERRPMAVPCARTWRSGARSNSVSCGPTGVDLIATTKIQSLATDYRSPARRELACGAWPLSALRPGGKLRGM